MGDQRNVPLDPVDLLGKDEKRNLCIVDRRSGFDRRRTYSLAYFADGGIERRSGSDRRRNPDRRQIWEMRGTPCSIFSD